LRLGVITYSAGKAVKEKRFPAAGKARRLFSREVKEENLEPETCNLKPVTCNGSFISTLTLKTIFSLRSLRLGVRNGFGCVFYL
jgi:hypothetical protein